MTGPSQGQIDVAIQSLRDDAQKWRFAAAELESAARAASEMAAGGHLAQVDDSGLLRWNLERQRQERLADEVLKWQHPAARHRPW